MSGQPGVITAAVGQLRLQVGEPTANRAAARVALETAARAGAQLVVLPELTPSGYVFSSPAEARSLAEPLTGESVREWRALSAQYDLTLVAGIAELGSAGEVYNTAVVLDRGELLGRYRKVHLWGDEPDFFTPGTEPPLICRTGAGTLAVMICYDLEFPEWARLAGLSGAELLTAPTNWPLAPRPDGERAIEVTKVQANAATNRMFVLAADRCGTERGVDWVSGSVIVDPNGYPVTTFTAADTPAVLLAELDLALARDKRLGDRNHVFDDRRPHLY